ncbi:MAG: NADH-quinone oxidoreductase subunit A [Pirellulales bacterium]
MTTPTSIVAYLALFAGVGFAFLFVNLLVGKLLRPHDPHAEKLEVYECGEPTIGSSFVQFDLRFYVVALLFIIFDVEVAFFFPWANVFGKATHLSDPRLPLAAEAPSVPGGELSSEARGLFREIGIENPVIPDGGVDAIRQSAHQLAWLSIWDIAVFFAVLMVGFAYVWKRGDLDWVRAVTHERPAEIVLPRPGFPEREPAMTA